MKTEIFKKLKENSKRPRIICPVLLASSDENKIKLKNKPDKIFKK